MELIFLFYLAGWYPASHNDNYLNLPLVRRKAVELPPPPLPDLSRIEVFSFSIYCVSTFLEWLFGPCCTCFGTLGPHPIPTILLPSQLDEYQDPQWEISDVPWYRVREVYETWCTDHPDQLAERRAIMAALAERFSGLKSIGVRLEQYHNSDSIGLLMLPLMEFFRMLEPRVTRFFITSDLFYEPTADECRFQRPFSGQQFYFSASSVDQLETFVRTALEGGRSKT
eukprot:TRINITY_DN4913_c0_g1_i3.p1 TRINITY_DN4913_c0_g1~~TRINITY_DN4913_c0_g1_i3.p1  ORF type:complete len:252 (-),score=50.89 TRINITY_DN4913_c0_g1_i3:404-1081(-)